MPWPGHPPPPSRLPGASSHSNQDQQVGRYDRTPGLMVLHPAGVRPLGTDSWVLAQLKPTGCPKGYLRWGAGASLPLISPRIGAWGQTLSGLAVTPRPRTRRIEATLLDPRSKWLRQASTVPALPHQALSRRKTMPLAMRKAIPIARRNHPQCARRYHPQCATRYHPQCATRYHLQCATRCHHCH